MYYKTTAKPKKNTALLQLLFALLLVCLFTDSAVAALATFEDDEACLMCHKYIRMARITDEGVFRSYYVPPETFSKTVHRNVPCRDCHSYIKQLPHRPVDVGVKCDKE